MDPGQDGESNDTVKRYYPRQWIQGNAYVIDHRLKAADTLYDFYEYSYY